MIPRVKHWHQNPTRALQVVMVAHQIINIVLGVIFAKWLATDQIGHYELWSLLILLFLFFPFQGMLQGWLSLAGKDIDSNLSLTSVHVGLIGWGLLFMALTWLLNLFFHFNWGFSGVVWESFLWFMAHGVFFYAAFIALYDALISANGLSILKFGFFGVILKGLSLALPIILGYDILSAIRWLAIGSMLYYFGSLLYRRPRSAFGSKDTWMRWLLTSMPLIAYGIFGFLPQVLDAMIINIHYQDPSSFAWFRYGSKDIPFIGALIGSVAMSALPRLNENREQGLALIRMEVGRLLTPLSLILGFIILVLPPAFGWIYNSEFAFSGFLLGVMIMTIVPRMILAHTVVMHFEKGRLLFVFGVIEVLINVGISVLLLHYLGMIGVVIGTVLAYWIEKLLLLIWLRKRGISFQDLMPEGRFWTLTFSLLLANVLSYVIHKPIWL